MNRREREQARQQTEALRQYRRSLEEKRAIEAAHKEAKIQAALSKKDGERRRYDVSFGWALQTAVERKAPKLFDVPDYVRALNVVDTLPKVRRIEDWEPKGKGRDSLYRSLCEHLLAEYPIPAVFWNAFFERDNAFHYKQLVMDVARGKSLFKCVQGNFPIPLTRAMCHDLMQMPSTMKFIDAIRRVQARAAGVEPSFYQAWRTTRQAQTIGTRTVETFWYSVLEWFAKVPMLNPNEVGPIYDYIAYRWREDPKFSMKGRTALSVIRGMHEWHGNLTKERSVKSNVFRMSGFKPATFGDYKRKEGNSEIPETWRVQEILTSRALYDEGRRMGHCVYSYESRILTNEISIWSITMEDGQGETGNWAMVTVEVRNDLRRIVQARGRYNRQTTHREDQVLQRWANMNSLTIGSAYTW